MSYSFYRKKTALFSDHNALDFELMLINECLRVSHSSLVAHVVEMLEGSLLLNADDESHCNLYLQMYTISVSYLI